MAVNTQPLSNAEIRLWFDNPDPAPPNTFEIALVLGGTVSAGAYTAGALDFLIEALDAWTAVRDGANAQTVPRHKVVIRLITGTSGGGVNAAIAARALAYPFPHVSRGTGPALAAGNPFYDTLINGLTLDGMLTTGDLDAAGTTAVSLLNGTVIDVAAGKATSFTMPEPKPRSYLAATVAADPDADEPERHRLPDQLRRGGHAGRQHAQPRRKLRQSRRLCALRGRLPAADDRRSAPRRIRARLQ